MSKIMRLSLLEVLLALFIVGCGQHVFYDDKQSLPEGPVYKSSTKGPVTEWVVLGAFPNPEVKEPLPDGSVYLGFYTDYLEPIGGEAKATLTENAAVEFTDGKGQKCEAKAQLVKAGPDGIIDLNELFGKIDYSIAYAFCNILSERQQQAGFLFGSDDDAKVWINSKLVHSNYVARGLSPGQDKFTAELHRGFNTILVKVSDRSREWGFVLEPMDANRYAEVLKYDRDKEDMIEFLNCRLVPAVGNPWDYTFSPGKFPQIKWDRPCLVEKVMGRFELDVRWFDSGLNEVSVAVKPGRYGYIAEGTTASGKVVRRAGTIFCRPEDWLGWSEKPKAWLEYFPVNGGDKQAWLEHKEAIAEYAGRVVLLSILRQQEGASLMSYLYEIKADGNKSTLTDTPVIRDHDYHLALKRKLMGVENKYPELKPPRRTEVKPATVLHSGTTAQAGVSEDAPEKIRAICQQWYENSNEPFNVLIARHGIVIIHEAFGQSSRGMMTVETPTEMASLTKQVTGLMFAQFVDQGLIGMDDPVGKYLTDLPTEGDKAITLRQCFTHTTGLFGHEEYGGMHNPQLENIIANGLEYFEVGKVHNYNGMGYDLAGKVMEVVSGKSIFRLMRENFFEPLGLKNTYLQEDLGFSCYSTAWDFGVIGQLLLNHGSYGELEFFSPEVFDAVLPKPLDKFYPGIKQEWGIGITWMPQQHPQAGQNGVPKDKTILSNNVIGHGSATSAILRVDLDNDLVIAQNRWIGGRDYDKYLLKFLMTINDCLVREE